MNLFINDVALYVVENQDQWGTAGYTSIFMEMPEPDLLMSLRGKVLLQQAEPHIERLVTLLYGKHRNAPLTLVLPVSEPKAVKKKIKSLFKVIDAAGGIVEQGEDILMIYRLGKWDLPKGKREKKESMKSAAVREVEEECGIEVSLMDKVTTTWHTYSMNDKRILKKTKWYLMSLVDDSHMQPQTEEDIEQVQWMKPEAVDEAMSNSYLSIKHVIDEYRKMKS